MNNYDLLVIGGDAGGMTAASQARRIDNSMSIAVFEKSVDVSYAACGMPYFISGDVGSSKDLLAIDREEFSKRKNISIFLESEAVGVDFEKKVVSFRQGKGTSERSYGTLVIATGASPFIPPIKGVTSPRVFPLRSLAQGIAIRKFIDSEKPNSGVIIGGGFIGLEMAESLRKRGIEITLLERLESVAMAMSPGIRKMVAETLRENGVSFHTGISIAEIEDRGSSVTVHGDGGPYSADFAILSVGIKPNTGFLTPGALALHEKGAIIVDDRSMTTAPDVYAAGDCATVRHMVTGKDVYMPLGTTANKQGRVAGLQAAGIRGERFPGIVGSQQVKVFDLEVGKTGLNESDALAAGIPARAAAVEGRSRAGYYPGARPILVNLVINDTTGTVIGCECAGTDGAALRSNIAAAAITTGMTVEQLAYLDLGYAPPFSPVWDPINTAAHLLMKR